MAQKVDTRHEMPLKYDVKLDSKDVRSVVMQEAREISTWLPINPAQTSSGALVSLAKLFGEDKAKPVPLPPNTPMTLFTLMATEIDLTLAAKLGIGNIFTGSLNYGDRAFYLDAMQFAEAYADIPGNPVVGTRWGVGVRVLLHVSDIKTDLSLNIGMVGAAVQLGYARALYEIDGIGIPDGLPIVLGELHGFGDFTAETWFKINDIVLPKLAEYMKQNVANLKPVSYEVQVIQPIDIDPLLAGRSIVFAMRRMRDGCTLTEALAHAAGKYDDKEIEIVYAKLAPDTPPNSHPPESSKDKAREWLADN